MTISFYLFRQGCALDSHSEYIISMAEDYLDNTLYHRVKPIRDNEASASMSSIDNNNVEFHNKKALSQMNNEITSLKKTSETKSSTNLDTNDSAAVPASSNHIIESILHEFLS